MIRQIYMLLYSTHVLTNRVSLKSNALSYFLSKTQPLSILSQKHFYKYTKVMIYVTYHGAQNFRVISYIVYSNYSKFKRDC